MAVKIISNSARGETYCIDAESQTSLDKGFYGVRRMERIMLFPEEALYLADIRNAKCFETEFEDTPPLKFNALARQFGAPRLMARYFAYKDWRDRGLVARQLDEAKGNYGRNPTKRYPSGKFDKPRYDVAGLFFPEDLVTTIDDASVGREIYERYWLGQFGTYKAEQRGNISKLDVYETLFMMKHCGLKLLNAKRADVVKAAEKKRLDFRLMYEVYEDWRLRGFVLKTGFKFGTHFRVYFPGASPVKTGDEWKHSRHVVHVFPRRERMLISEWARAIRVAHSVKKTFILAIPGVKKQAREAQVDFLLYHRKKGGIETPKEDKPRFLMLALSEEEYIGGEELAEAIEKAKGVGLDLILAISDRESSITYYRVRRIELPGSKYEYYEIEWVQP